MLKRVISRDEKKIGNPGTDKIWPLKDAKDCTKKFTKKQISQLLLNPRVLEEMTYDELELVSDYNPENNEEFRLSRICHIMMSTMLQERYINLTWNLLNLVIWRYVLIFIYLLRKIFLRSRYLMWKYWPPYFHVPIDQEGNIVPIHP